MAEAHKSTATTDKHDENVLTKTAHTIAEKFQGFTGTVKEKAHEFSVGVKEKTQQLTHHDNAKKDKDIK